ncbi:MAG: bifunctional methylenetetrahydrofolate dehydrogenase/methenyltetrahydrofolate cyclohydrolase FolD [bacterium]
MAAKIINGRAIAQNLQEKMGEEIHQIVDRGGMAPGLAVILVGENPASQVYVRMKKKACEKVGIYNKQIVLPATTKEKELKELVEQLNNDKRIHGILVQSPLPDHINFHSVIEIILPQKDVDGFHPVNMGNLLLGIPKFISCTPLGIMELFKRENIELKGKRAVVVGRSNIVGKPMMVLLILNHATVTVCHTRTQDLASITREADIIVAAAGKANIITADMVKEGVVVIDVGMNRVDGKLVGDVDFAKVSQKASYITPVPGGVGPMTVTMLLHNTIKAYKEQLI